MLNDDQFTVDEVLHSIHWPVICILPMTRFMLQSTEYIRSLDTAAIHSKLIKLGLVVSSGRVQRPKSTDQSVAPERENETRRGSNQWAWVARHPIIGRGTAEKDRKGLVQSTTIDQVRSTIADHTHRHTV